MDSELLNLTLLYVEDDYDTRVSLAEVFKHKVKNFYVARDGVEALELFKKHKIHFIISDFQMPKINGTQLCRAIKNINSSVQFILLTAYNDFNLLVDAIDSGVDKFLLKPVNPDKLFTVMDETYKKIMNNFQLEKSTVCLMEAEKIANLSYWDVNLSTKVISFSKEAQQLFNLSSDGSDHVDYKIFSNIVQEEDREKFLEIFKSRVFKEDEIDEVIAIKNTKNENIYVHLAAKKWESSTCGNKHVIGLFQDISRYETQRLVLLKQSQSDPMLNIANKKLLILELQNLILSSKRYGHSLGVIFFDIDDFKYINDRYGHLKADEILVELVNLIKSNVRQSDHFGRWGGDEFVVVTGYSSPEAIISLVEKLLEKVKTYSWIENIDLTISLGVSFYELGDDVKSLIHKADLKMLEAKKNGKNRYCF